MTGQFSVVVHDSVLYEPVSEEELLTLFFPSRTITARDLICQRVRQEVQAYNEKLPEVFHGLVVPSDAERVLNGYRLPHKRTIDVNAQCQRACEAFEQNRFLLLLDDRQVETLDQTIEIRASTTVTFLKLTPLVGG